MNFSYSKELEGQLARQVKVSLISAVCCIILPILMFFFTSKELRNDHSGIVILVFVLFGGVAIFEYLRSLKNAKVRGNLIKCQMQIDVDKISGTFSENMEVPNSTKYFEIALCDIRSVEILVPQIGPNKEYATLRINTKCGTTKVAIDNAEQAKKTIQTAIDRAANC